MELNNLKPAEGSVKRQGKRVGRGQGSGKGGTATRGHNGAKSRSGYSKKLGFEGGQMPLQRRVPKFGFTNINRIEHQGINLDTLQQLVDDKKIKGAIDFETIVALGLARCKKSAATRNAPVPPGVCAVFARPSRMMAWPSPKRRSCV